MIVNLNIFLVVFGLMVCCKFDCFLLWCYCVDIFLLLMSLEDSSRIIFGICCCGFLMIDCLGLLIFSVIINFCFLLCRNLSLALEHSPYVDISWTSLNLHLISYEIVLILDKLLQIYNQIINNIIFKIPSVEFPFLTSHESFQLFL